MCVVRGAVWGCMCGCMCECMWCMCVHVHACMCMRACGGCMCVYACCVCVDVYVCLCMCVCVDVYGCVWRRSAQQKPKEGDVEGTKEEVEELKLEDTLSYGKRLTHELMQLLNCTFAY